MEVMTPSGEEQIRAAVELERLRGLVRSLTADNERLERQLGEEKARTAEEKARAQEERKRADEERVRTDKERERGERNLANEVKRSDHAMAEERRRNTVEEKGTIKGKKRHVSG